jgi:hypothetical protein
LGGATAAFLVPAAGFSVPVASRIVVAAGCPSADLNRAGRAAAAASSSRIFSRGFDFERRAAAGCRTAARDELLEEDRRGGTPAPCETRDPVRRAVRRLDTERNDIVPPLPGAEKPNPLTVRIR